MYNQLSVTAQFNCLLVRAGFTPSGAPV